MRRALILQLLLVAACLAQLPPNFIDRYSSTLSGGYTSGGTSATVSNASGIPSGAVNFYMLVKAEGGNTEEAWHVTNNASGTLTLTGAACGTSASNHGAGAQIIASINCAAVMSAIAAPILAPSGSTVNLYISGSGSDSNPCSSSSKCLTLAHALSLVPAVPTQPYTINVADATYTEGLNFSGYTNTFSNLITVVGDTSTPANVVFSGNVTCTHSDASYTVGACVNGANVKLSGMTVSGGSDRGVLTIDGGHSILSDVVVSGSVLYSVECSLLSACDLFNHVTVSGFSSTAGHGIHVNLHSTVAMYNTCTLTVTGPTGNNTAAGIQMQEGALFTIHEGTGGSITITGVQTGIYGIGSGTIFDSRFSTQAISVTNTSTPTASNGIFFEEMASYNANPTTLTVTHFTTCLIADGNALIVQKSVTYSNCGTNSSASQQAQIITF